MQAPSVSPRSAAQIGNPSILVVERVAKALGVDVSEIFKPN
ncbi:hypothetical protein Salmuc_02721 [Salipiger mucosus DSM 16094]|uniref:HTH cro/C1-type domain-containing protein n=1 Tax=Salipiger mucosus DSM 16094 TaxID=1123237 RepID=S9R0E1_9RHOB|nr:hypothetical protein Salmuc_02721 [Salipiger mucosus DSM 16094]